MSNVFNLIKPQAKLPRNGFDLSQRHLLTAKVGQLLPILTLDCVPGDHHEINVLEMARTMPVNTDAFVRMKQYFEFYFVPYEQIQGNFNQFITQRDDPFSTNITNQKDQCVCYGLRDMLQRVTDMKTEAIKDVHGFDAADNALRLLDLLGYGAHYGNYKNANYRECYRAFKMNPYRLCAYQKIWYDYYRNAYFDNEGFYEPVSGNYIPYIYSYNVDDCIEEADIDTARGVERQLGMFQLHYRQWKKDLFTGLLPDATFGRVTYVDMAGYHESDWQDVQSVNGVDIDVYAILKAQALQKWREATMKAGNRVSDNWKAHYGVEPRFHRDTRAQFVGAFDSMIGIDEVVSTSGFDQQTLGAIGGKGIGGAQGTINFDCNDFGVLMCIYSVLPTADYDAIGIDKANTLFDHFDFFTPEFENLGFEPVQTHQISGYCTPAQGFAGSIHLLDVLGYAPRYYMYKTAVDKVHGEFMSQLSPQTPLMADGSSGGSSSGSLSHWVSTRRDFSYIGVEGAGHSPYQPTLSTLYVNPKVMDSVFVNTAQSSQQTDHVMINSNFDIKSVRNMSVLGLPQF